VIEPGTYVQDELYLDTCPLCGQLEEITTVRDMETHKVLRRMCIDCWWTTEGYE